MKYLLLLIVTALSFAATAQQSSRKGAFNLNKPGVAASGYDVVAYFNQNKAVKGSRNYAVSAEGVTYNFSNQQNKELFLKNWKNYEPQYGGWCAYAMGNSGEKVEIDPETFKILNGKLYLFYHSWANNTLNKWNKDENSLKQKADGNWSKIFN